MGIKACHKTHSWGKVGSVSVSEPNLYQFLWVIHDNILFPDTILGIQKPLNTHFMGKYTVSLMSLTHYWVQETDNLPRFWNQSSV